MEKTSLDSDASFLRWASQLLHCDPVVSPARGGEGHSISKLTSGSSAWFLKIGPDLDGERERLEWLQPRLPVPHIIGFRAEDDREALLISAVSGTDLAELCTVWPPEKVTHKLAEALRRFHATTITDDCPFTNTAKEGVLLHGDACLPNFIFSGDDLSGYVDLRDCTVGDPIADLSAAVWSLHYNLGPGHGLRFLQEYGIAHVDEEMVERLRQNY